MILYISYKKAKIFYTLEGGIEKSSATIIEHENLFYKIVRKGTGRKWAGLVVMQLKRFLRKKANYARIAYVVGLVGFMTWFISSMTEDTFGRVVWNHNTNCYRRRCRKYDAWTPWFRRFKRSNMGIQEIPPRDKRFGLFLLVRYVYFKYFYRSVHFDYFQYFCPPRYL